MHEGPCNSWLKLELSSFHFVSEKTYRTTLLPARIKSNARGILALEKEATGLAGMCNESVSTEGELFSGVP
jgi:hypothetical protein